MRFRHRCTSETVRSLDLTRQLRKGRTTGYGGFSSDSHTADVFLEVYGDVSLQTWTWYLEESTLVPPDTIHSLYTCFGFKIINNLHLGVSKNLKVIFENFVSRMTTSQTLLGGFGARNFYKIFQRLPCSR